MTRPGDFGTIADMETTYDRRGHYVRCNGPDGQVWIGRLRSTDGDVALLEATLATTETWVALPDRFVESPVTSVLGVHVFSNRLREVVQWCDPAAQVDVAIAEFCGVQAVLVRSHDRVAVLAACDARGQEPDEVLV